MASQYSAYALPAGLARLYARMRMHSLTRPGSHMHARTRKHAHTRICNAYCSPRQQWFRERASLLRYTYIVCIVSLIVHIQQTVFKFICTAFVLFSSQSSSSCATVL